MREVDDKKQLLILINKSDFLTPEFRWGLARSSCIAMRECCHALVCVQVGVGPLL